MLPMTISGSCCGVEESTSGSGVRGRPSSKAIFSASTTPAIRPALINAVSIVRPAAVTL
jgi:hypothetical protein